MNNKKLRVLMPIVLAAVLVLGLACGFFIGIFHGRVAPNGRHMGTSAKDKLNYTFALIDQMYVDPVNMDSLKEQLLPHLIAELDPHSIYIPASETSEVNETLEGEFDGIGVFFNMATDTIRIVNVITSGPSDKAGVRNGDRIIKINDSLVAGKKIPQEDIVKKLRGKRGTKVKLSLQRSGIADLVPVTVTRGIIPIKSIDAAFMIKPGIGFLKLSAFSKNSYREIMQALGDLKKEGMTRLIFDLRGNTGGFLDQAIMISNEFLPDGDMIVYTLDRRHNRTEEFSKGGKYTSLPLVLLIDEGTASSSEILAGAIQDNDRGTIIGRRSYGKGLVQQQIHYPDNSALRLTIARYYTPTGRSIQKPYVKGDKNEYEHDMENRYNNNEFFSSDSIKFADSLRFTTPSGRTVYGGGGIMPDIFIPWDTTDMTHYYLEVWGRNILYKYTLDYVDRNQKKMDEIKTTAQLHAILDSDKSLINNFISYATSHGVDYNEAQFTKSRRLIEAQIKAYIGRNTPIEDAGFYTMIYPIDEPVNRAITELEK